MTQNTRVAFIRHLLKNERAIEPSPDFSYKALVKSRQDYDAMYKRSIDDPEKFHYWQARYVSDMLVTCRTQQQAQLLCGGQLS